MGSNRTTLDELRTCSLQVSKMEVKYMKAKIGTDLKMVGVRLILVMVLLLALPVSVKAVSFGANESSLIAYDTTADIDFFMLSQFYGISENESLKYTFTSTPTGWSGNISGTYKGKQLKVEYSGKTFFPEGVVTWTSKGSYGSDIWVGSGSTLIKGTGGNFQVDFNSSLNIGNNKGSSKYLINGIENASEIKYVNSSGTTWINGKALSSGQPMLDIHISEMNIVIYNSFKIWFIKINTKIIIELPFWLGFGTMNLIATPSPVNQNLGIYDTRLDIFKLRKSIQ